MAGVVNHCQFCGEVLWDAETASPRCNYCKKEGWNKLRNNMTTSGSFVKVAPATKQFQPITIELHIATKKDYDDILKRLKRGVVAEGKPSTVYVELYEKLKRC